ncbi:sorting nexin 2B-like [Andrographis paniculata]|uniref:sorting nexin 2B-like n=1 Tax=Andrographis paniculata TaxID=175694 RepID=UPI0021E93C08|nr:sorting nexin 2B-like [Andrographis paniculata]
MMGSEPQSDHPLARGNAEDEESPHLPSEQMQTLALNDDDDDWDSAAGDVSSSKSYSNYRSAMTALSPSASEHHPLSPPPSVTAASDPLSAPPRSRSLDSPSYADVIVSPFHDRFPESNGSGEISDDAANSSSPRSESSGVEYLKIIVSNPQKEVEPSNSVVTRENTYTSYQITTSTNIADYGGSSFSVRRRFKDVVTLSDRLSESYRGFFIPPRPDKSVVESQVMQKQDFLEQRRVELEKYLKRLAKHPLIKKSDELRVFLTVNGRMPLPTSIDMASRMLDGAARLPKQLLGESSSVIEPQDVSHSAKGGRDILRYLKELKQSVVNDWGNTKAPLEEEDKEFLEKKVKMYDFERHLTSASKQAESLVKAQHDMGETLGELGLAFIKLTKFENEQATMNTQRARAGDMKYVATAAVKASRLYKGLNGQTVKHFDTLLEHMGMLLAAHNAFSDRASALLTVQTLISELSSLHSRAEKLEAASSKVFGGDKSRTRKLEDLKEAIKVTEDAKSCAIKEYERIMEHNRSEIQRLDRERQTDFVEMLKGLVTNQMSYHEKLGNEWAKVVEETRKYAKDST